MGFKIVDLMSGEEKILAHVNQRDGPHVSKYRVNVANVDTMSEKAIGGALEEADYVVIDEIAPMELHSEGFKRWVVAALESPKPLLAAVHQRTCGGFIGDMKARADVEIFEVTPITRADLPTKLAEKIKLAVGMIHR